MTDKELQQVEEMLSGQKRYKLLDCDRMGILLRLSGACLKVWLALRSKESDDQEAWLSNRTLMRLTGLSKPTIIAARKKLVALGCLRETGETAASKYSLPSRGAHSVKVVRVDDPTGKDTLPGKKTLPKVCSCCCCCPCRCITGTDARTGTRSTTAEASPLKTKAKATTKTTTKTTTLASEAKAIQKYGQPFPPDFNSWNTRDKAIWVASHEKAEVKVLPVQPEETVLDETKTPVQTEAPIQAKALPPVPVWLNRPSNSAKVSRPSKPSPPPVAPPSVTHTLVQGMTQDDDDDELVEPDPVWEEQLRTLREIEQRAKTDKAERSRFNRHLGE